MMATEAVVSLMHTGVFVIVAELSDGTAVDFIGRPGDVDTWMYEALYSFGGHVTERRELTASQVHGLHGEYCGYAIPTLAELGIGVMA